MEVSFLDTIWNEFGVESEEHCEQLEHLLLFAENGALDAEGIASLFRSFHSLKGLAKALDLIAMETLAHRCEDLLGLVRDGSLAMTPQIAALLLQALDYLKEQRARAVEERADSEKPEELIRALERACGAPEAGGANAVEPEPIVTAAGGVCLQLHEDPEILQFFLEMVKAQIPAISALMEPPPDRSSAEVCQTAIESLESIEHAASVMGFANICDVVSRVREELPVTLPISTSEHEPLVSLIKDFHDQVCLLGAETGSDMDEGQLARALVNTVQSSLGDLFKDILRNLEALEHAAGDEGTIDDDPIAEELQRDLTTVSSHLSFFVPQLPCELLLLLADAFGRAARGELLIFTEIVTVSREIVRHFSTMFRGGTPNVQPPPELNRENYTKQIMDYVWANDSGASCSPVETVRDFVRSLSISSELAEILSPENVRDLMDGVKKGGNLYELLTDLESSEEVALSFLTWVNEVAQVITNRSVFIDNHNWYEMLLVTSLERKALEEKLAEIDPGGKFLLLKAASSDVSLDQRKPAKAPAKEQPQGAAANLIRVPGEMLDYFMNQIGEMVLTRSQLSHALKDEEAREALLTLKQLSRQGGFERILPLVERLEEHQKRLAESDVLLHSTLGRLQEGAMGLRVVPVETVFKRFPRVVRDMSVAQGKKIRLEFSGQEVKIDKAMVEVLTDPLLHMVRNAVDHAIELPEEREACGKPAEAVVLLKARQQGNSIIVEIVDDGRGIDTDRVAAKAVERGLATHEQVLTLSKEAIYDFLFLPGFSTAAAVTETSGRGVGMDVVRTNVSRLGGNIRVDSEVGRGSTFTLRMPLSAAVQEVLMVVEAGQTLAVPGRYVAEIIQVEAESIQSVKGRHAILLRGRFLPLVRLSRLLGFPCAEKEGADQVAVVVTNGPHTLGVLVDRVQARQELYTKDIQAALASLPGVGGASILGDGKVVLILDGESLFKLAEKCPSDYL